jgi:glycosyltransferase involved in cell wall biosynthesis
MVNPAISVVLPVYNPPLAALDQAIGSILSQTFRDFELLILNDGSTHDRLRCQLDQWAARDARVRIFEEPHRGLTPTLNRGLLLARGEFIARQDADDWSEADRFSRQIAYLRAHPEVALTGTDAQLHRADGKPLWRLRLPRTPEELSRAFLKGNPFVHGSTLYRRELALAIGGYREQFPCSQDYDFFWRMAERAGAVNLDQALYHYRYSSGAVSAQRGCPDAGPRKTVRRSRGHWGGAAGGGRDFFGRLSRSAQTSRPFDAGRRFFRSAKSLSAPPAVASGKRIGLGENSPPGGVRGHPESP